MGDEFSERYRDLLTGVYDCVDRIVINAYFGLGHSPGGFRTWWRLLHGNDKQLDNAHLIRMAGRFARRLRATCKAQGIQVIDCQIGDPKYKIAKDYLASHQVSAGLFLVLAARALVPVWDVKINRGGNPHLVKKRAMVNNYSFHIMDAEWGHLVIKLSGHPPFPAQIILNGHDYVACQARAQGLAFEKEGNCFTNISDPVALAQIADTLSQPANIERLMQVAERWIYSSCLIFALDLEERDRSGFHYGFSSYQLEYSRNLQFRSGRRMEAIFERMLDRTRSRLDLPSVRTIFGTRRRPHYNRRSGPQPRMEAAVERPEYGLTRFKILFGRLQLKAYTKGERTLRLEVTVHNTEALRCGRALDRLPQIFSRLRATLDRFALMLDCVDIGFVDDDHILDRLPDASQLGRIRVGGIDLNRPRMRSALRATLALCLNPAGFSAAQFAAEVRRLTGQAPAKYSLRQAGYDIRKIRAKGLIVKRGLSRRYLVPASAARTISALLTLRDDVIVPLLAGVGNPPSGPKPSLRTAIDSHYETLRVGMLDLFQDLGIGAAA
ncbi:MAG TPA: hypothetical protein VF160_07155 [Candidatus Dormibacteraeota bacterium]